MKPAATLFILALLAHAQQFEVAAIHPAKGTTLNSNIMGQPGGRLIADNVTLQTLIRVAYNVSTIQILAGPSWMKSERFDIQAKTGTEAAKLKDMRPELQALLAERFGLKLHRDRKDMFVNVLVPAKSGLRIAESAEGDGLIRMTKRMMDGNRVTADQVAKALSDATGTLLLDQTGYAGYFDVHIKWLPEGEEVKEDSPASLNEVLAEQYGLVIRNRKTAVPVIVVDGAVKPGDN